jgi:cell division protein FtsX
MKQENENFLKGVQNRLRAKKKKLDKILATEKKIKNKEIMPKQEQMDLISQKLPLEIAVSELEHVISAISKSVEDVEVTSPKAAEEKSEK